MIPLTRGEDLDATRQQLPSHGVDTQAPQRAVVQLRLRRVAEGGVVARCHHPVL